MQERAEAAVQSGVALTAPRPPYTLSVRRTAPAVGRVSELGPVSTNYLSATHRIQLEELLHRARFFDLPPRLPLEYVVPGDVFQEITVASDKVTRVVGYEREGARHPAELDEVVSLLERMAGWQQIHLSAGLARHPGEVPATWTPTGNVPPLGALAAQETVSRSAVGGPPGAVGGGRRDRRRHRDRALRSACRDGAASATRDRCSPESARRRVAARTDRRVAAARAAAAADGTAAAPPGGTRRRDGPLPTLVDHRRGGRRRRDPRRRVDLPADPIQRA